MGGAVVVAVVVVKVDAGTGDALKAPVSRRLPSIKAMRSPRDAVVDATVRRCSQLSRARVMVR